ASVSAPADGAAYLAAAVPSPFTGSAADNSGGAGLNANASVTFTLQRGSDNMYWNSGGSWQVAVANLATTSAATTGNTPAVWNDNVTLPNWTTSSPDTYTVTATATDKVGNTFT